jgi:lipopolysaccharide/colanic/teichoic acid biosynthesis glycosyltransferase
MPSYPRAKRLLDVTIVGALVVTLLPFEILAVLAVALDMLFVREDRGSLLYREPRVSRGRTFILLKVRTVRLDVLVEARGHVRPLESDPENLTWSGRRLLKPWYLDELPQLLNVLRGDISLVGPRPWPPPLVAQQLAEGFDYRNRVVAGLTGPAQVSKGSDQRYVDLDLEYVEALRTLRSWQLIRYDLRILVRTLTVLARGEGLNY